MLAPVLAGTNQRFNAMKNRLVQLVVLFVLAESFIFWFYSIYLVTEPSSLLSTTTNEKSSPIESKKLDCLERNNRMKSILIWNASFRKEVRAFGSGSRRNFAKQGCAYTRCLMTDDRWRRPLESYDAIVIVFNDEFLSQEEMEMPRFDQQKRNANQRLVFFTQESPPALSPHYNMSHFPNFFNWTMTYKLSSDIPFLYGRIVPKKYVPEYQSEVVRFRREGSRVRPQLFQKIKKKTKMAAWMVSHCDTDSQREKYVKELERYIDVDTYGGCGNLSCARHILHHSDPQCYDMLETKYKFYFSFENSVCTDYVTEKFFKIMKHDIVPVVYGGADYRQHAPLHSFIDAKKYTPKELAAYLKLLDSNESLYSEYFWWKDYYQVEASVEDMSRRGFCDLCQKLHQDLSCQSYSDMSSFWGNNGGQCQSVDSQLIFSYRSSR